MRKYRDITESGIVRCCNLIFTCEEVLRIIKKYEVLRIIIKNSTHEFFINSERYSVGSGEGSHLRRGPTDRPSQKDYNETFGIYSYWKTCPFSYIFYFCFCFMVTVGVVIFGRESWGSRKSLDFFILRESPFEMHLMWPQTKGLIVGYKKLVMEGFFRLYHL